MQTALASQLGEIKHNFVTASRQWSLEEMLTMSVSERDELVTEAQGICKLFDTLGERVHAFLGR